MSPLPVRNAKGQLGKGKVGKGLFQYHISDSLESIEISISRNTILYMEFTVYAAKIIFMFSFIKIPPT